MSTTPYSIPFVRRTSSKKEKRFVQFVRLALLFPTASDLQFTSSAERCFVVKNPCYLCYLWENKNNIPSINVCHCDTRTRVVHKEERLPVPLTFTPLFPMISSKKRTQYV